MGFRCCPPVRKTRQPYTPGAALSREERAVKRAFEDAVRILADPNRIRFVGGAIELQNLSDFVVAMDPAVQAITSAVGQGIQASALDIPQGVRGQFRFDVRDPRAAAWAQQRAGVLIRQISDEQRLIARNIIQQSVEEGWDTARTAQELRNTVGLHQRWANAVLNHHDDALGRFLRQGLSTEKATERAAASAAKYRERLIRARAQNIARTEILTAQNQGRWLGWAQGVEQGFVSPQAKKRWVTGSLGAAPGRKQVCEICRGLRDEKVRWDEPFSTGVMMPPAHPSCRCTAVVEPLSIDEVRDRLAREREQGVELPAEPAAPTVGSHNGPGGRTPSGEAWDGPVPKFTSTADAEAWFDQKWGKTFSGDGRVIKFGNIDVAAAQEFATELDRCFRLYPKVAENIREVGSAQALGRNIGSAIGQASRGSRFLHWNEREFTNYGQAQAKAAKMKQQKWLTVDHPAGVIHHEFGHHVHYVLEGMGNVGIPKVFGQRIQHMWTRVENLPFLKSQFDPLIRAHLKVKGQIGLRGKYQIEIVESLSQYGTTNYKEFFAEAFSESMLADAGLGVPRPLAQAVRARADELIGELADPW